MALDDKGAAMENNSKNINNKELIGIIRKSIQKSLKKEDDEQKNIISTLDCVMSAYAVFSLKYPSLLQFDDARKSDKTLRHNLESLYAIEMAPSDTQMCDRIDGLSVDIIQKAMNDVLYYFKRIKKLDYWKFMDDKYLILMDGTQTFSSKDIHCPHCCDRTYNRGKENEYKTYNHQMVVAVIAHPDLKTVIPIAFEPICRSDGDEKNDCEKNASKRLLEKLKKYHPDLKGIIGSDGLSSNAPFINMVQNLGYDYLLVAKDDDHKHLKEIFFEADNADVIDFTEDIKNGTKRHRSLKNTPLNKSNSNLLTTVLYTEEITEETYRIGKKKGQIKGKKRGISYKCMWVTSLRICRENIKHSERGGRCRWKIENETFNTLKKLGYNFKHNFGHGKKTLSNFLSGTMLLAFLVDQCLETFNKEFKLALKKAGSRIALWERIRSVFYWFYISDWDNLFEAIYDPPTFNI